MPTQEGKEREGTGVFFACYTVNDLFEALPLLRRKWFSQICLSFSFVDIIEIVIVHRMSCTAIVCLRKILQRNY